MRWLIMMMVWFVMGWSDDVARGKSIVLTLPMAAGEIVGGEHNVSVVSDPLDPLKGMAIVPVDYYSPVGDLNLTWIAPGHTLPLPLSVRDFPYPTEVLSVEPSKVTPPPEALERIAQEKAEAEAIYAHFTPVRYWHEPFVLPLESNVTSPYGSARTYNGVLKSYHGGVDFRARTPLPILASNDGIVVLVKERYYAGGTVIIDHGEGIYSCYFHLSRFDVNVGDRVRRGQPIALSGATGRITGPHLHFGMMVYGVQTDPLELLAQLNHRFAPADVAP